MLAGVTALTFVREITVWAQGSSCATPSADVTNGRQVGHLIGAPLCARPPPTAVSK